MDSMEIRKLGPKLHQFLGQFDDCIKSSGTRAHLFTYVEGQLSDLPRKSVEPIALWHGMAPRTLQEFLSFHSWDDEKLRDRVAKIAQSKHGGAHAIGVFDETGNPKKGKQTPGVQRQ